MSSLAEKALWTVLASEASLRHRDKNWTDSSRPWWEHMSQHRYRGKRGAWHQHSCSNWIVWSTHMTVGFIFRNILQYHHPGSDVITLTMMSWLWQCHHYHFDNDIITLTMQSLSLWQWHHHSDNVIIITLTMTSSLWQCHHYHFDNDIITLTMTSLSFWERHHHFDNTIIITLTMMPSLQKCRHNLGNTIFTLTVTSSL